MEQKEPEATARAAGRFLLSIVVPVFDEQDIIETAHRHFVATLGIDREFDLEIVYVDDGSRDRTPLLLAALAAEDPRVCIVSFSRNFGQEAAVTAGLRHCAGDAAAVMDADLQDPPEVVLQMLEKWREGYAVVYGIRHHRQESAFRRLLFSAFYRILSALSDVPIPLDSGDFCVMDRRVIDALNALPEKRRFVRALRAWYGGRQYGFAYDRHARAAGRSKYSLRRYFHLAVDGIFSFSAAPLRLLALAGLMLSFFSLAGFLFVLMQWMSGLRPFGYAPAEAPGFTILILSLFLMSGVQLLSIGILGGYLGRIYLESTGRPAYIAETLRPSVYRRPAGQPTAAPPP